MASTYLTRTPSSAGNRKTFTISTWVKLSITSGAEASISHAGTSGGNYTLFDFDSSNQIRAIWADSGSGIVSVISNAIYRDINGWYHIVYAVDTTQATASDRVKMYVNGEQVTSFSSSTYPSQNYDTFHNSTSYANNVGKYINTSGNDGNFLNGSLAHYHFIDGTAYDASYFGSTDATTGIWKPNTSPSVTYGTNGFFLKFANSGSMGTDSSGNGNNLTVSGNLTQTQDTPSNVFATLNPLNVNRWNNSNDYTLGNLYYNSGNGRGIGASTLGVTKGKWYWELKIASTALYPGVGDLTILNPWTIPFYDNSNSGAIAYNTPGGGVYTDTGSPYSSGSYPSATTNDIVSFALDMDNYALYVAKNGTWLNSGDPTSGASKTGDMATAAGYTTLLNNGNPMFPVFVDTSTVGHGSCYINFGNGYFGTTAVSSAESDGNGLGLFEYAPPTGYYALCTKNINSQEYS